MREALDGPTRRLGRPLAGPAVAFAGMLAFWAYAAWSVRNDVPRPFEGTVSVVVALAVWLLVGLVAGLVSGRFRDALATWGATVAALATAVLVARAVDPDWPTGDLPVEASIA